MRRICAGFTCVHADGGGAEVGNSNTVSAVAGNVGGHIQGDPPGSKRTKGSDLSTQGRSIGVVHGELTPGVVKDRPEADTRTVAVVGEEQQPNLGDGATDASDGETQVGMHIGRAIQPQGGGCAMIDGWVGSIYIGVGNREEGYG